MQNGKKIGKRIKNFREFRQISRDELAIKSNLDLSQLASIEDEGKVPSLGHLIKITRALGVRLGTFLDDQAQEGPVLVKSGSERVGSSFSTKDEKVRQHLNFFSLAPEKSGRHMEPFIIEIEPAQASDYKLSSHEGEEFLYVLSGEVEINYGKEVYNLEEGDSIYIDSIVGHNVHAAGENTAKVLGVIYYPV